MRFLIWTVLLDAVLTVAAAFVFWEYAACPSG